ncbi:MAG TPA: serine protease [Pirellulales bacterium]|nr:serine protease [Pirellulales bacterium]
MVKPKCVVWLAAERSDAPVRRGFGAVLIAAFLGAAAFNSTTTFAQSVGLPAPRLLTTMPMGGKAGAEVEVTISGENLASADELVFSDPRIQAKAKLDAAGKPEPNKYLVAIAADCPPGLYEARMMSRLGVSSARVFSVGSLPEAVRAAPNTSLATAMELPMNSVCNAVVSPRAVDHYFFTARKGQRVAVECAAQGIDSKLNAVLVVANAAGQDLQVERQGGVLDFTAPADGKYVIKVNDLTYNGGPAYFYRLVLQELSPGAPVAQHPATRSVSSMSWPPAGLGEQAQTTESEPNNDRGHAQKIALPCDIAGSFFPAADVDVFEFEAKKGDEWWVEIASERLGRPTDPAAIVQHVSGSGDAEKLTDVAELSDIPSPVKVSSNGYAYDGPPYNAGSSDFLGKLTIQHDGVHRLQLSDLFGGTRSDPRNIYRLVIRKAAPDFAVAAWALHMELRNGDRAALSKPLALRGGATMALEVVVVRRDGFDGDIELAMEGLPQGVTAKGLKIPAGQSRGIMVVTAHQDAPRALASAKFTAKAQIGGAEATRPVRLASFAWPIPDSWGEIPHPRLLADVPVSVSGNEFAPLTIAPAKSEVWEVTAGEKLTIPLVLTRRSEFSGATMKVRTFGAGFERVPQFDVPLTADATEAVLDLGALKTPPGDYLIAFYGGAVAKYRDNAQAGAAEAAKAAPSRDIVDIVVSEPIAIRVKPAEKK